MEKMLILYSAPLLLASAFLSWILASAISSYPLFQWRPLDSIVSGAFLGVVYGWAFYTLGPKIQDEKYPERRKKELEEWKKKGRSSQWQKWHTNEWQEWEKFVNRHRWGLAAWFGGLGGLFGLHIVSYWAFVCLGIFAVATEMEMEGRSMKGYVVAAFILGSATGGLALSLGLGALGWNTTTIPWLGIIVGAICGLIPFVNVLYGLIIGSVIGVYIGELSHFQAGFLSLFLLCVLLSYLVVNKLDKEYEHSVGSGVVQILLYFVLTSFFFLLTQLQRLNWMYSLIFASLTWLPASWALVEMMIRMPKGLEKKRKLQEELEEVEVMLQENEIEIRELGQEKQDLGQKLEEPHSRMRQIDSEVNTLLESDPKNLRNLLLRVEDLREQVRGFSKVQIQEREESVNGALDEARRRIENNKKRLKALGDEIEDHEKERWRIESRIEELALENPSVELRLRSLREDREKMWLDFDGSAAETARVLHDIERLFKGATSHERLFREKCLLDVEIQVKKKEMDEVSRNVKDAELAIIINSIEKLILEHEKTSRNLGVDQSRFVAIGPILEKLEIERNGLSERKGEISKNVAEMQALKPHLQATKGICSILGAAFVASFLLNALIIAGFL